jgi:hypothetical protein
MDEKVSKSFEDYEKEFKKLGDGDLVGKHHMFYQRSDEYGMKKSQFIAKTRGDYHCSSEWRPLYSNFTDIIQRPMIVLERLMEARGIEIPQRKN